MSRLPHDFLVIEQEFSDTGRDTRDVTDSDHGRDLAVAAALLREHRVPDTELGRQLRRMHPDWCNYADVSGSVIRFAATYDDDGDD